jgi:hypothetical protein
MAKRQSTIPPFPDDIDRQHFASWLSGFSDGESTFTLRFQQQTTKSRLSAQTHFRITLRDDDVIILQRIQSFWSCGNIHRADNSRSKIPNAKPTASYCVPRVSDLTRIIIPHFEKYPLQSKKQGDFLIWRKGVELIASVQSRPRRGRTVNGRNRLGRRLAAGWLPNWTEDEWHQFSLIVDDLKAQRRYHVL